MSNTDTWWIAFLQHDILRNPLVSRKRTLADFRKTKTPFRSGCNYARRKLLPAVWEEVRQGEKSNDFPSVSYQRTGSSKPFTQLNGGWRGCAAARLIVPMLHLVFTTDNTRKAFLVLPRWRETQVYIKGRDLQCKRWNIVYLNKVKLFVIYQV